MRTFFLNNSWLIVSFTILLVCPQNNLTAQTTLKGKVLDNKGNAVPFCNVYLENTLDGTTTDTLGRYMLKTTEKGEQQLVVSSVGYQTTKQAVTLDRKLVQVDVKLKAEAVNLNEVVVTAGSFEANNDREVAILKPLDIYNNAGAGGDIVGAIRSLPGTQRVGEQTGLFVRGGDARSLHRVFLPAAVLCPFSSKVSHSAAGVTVPDTARRYRQCWS